MNVLMVFLGWSMVVSKEFKFVVFFLLVSLKFLLVLKSFNGVSRQFKGCLKIKGSFKDVSKKL